MYADKRKGVEKLVTLVTLLAGLTNYLTKAREERESFFWLLAWGYRPSWWRRQDYRSLRQLFTSHVWTGSRQQGMLVSVHSLPFTPPSHGMVLAFSLSLSILSHSQNFLTDMTTDLIKVIIFNHHNNLSCPALQQTMQKEIVPCAQNLDGVCSWFIIPQLSLNGQYIPVPQKITSEYFVAQVVRNLR